MVKLIPQELRLLRRRAKRIHLQAAALDEQLTRLIDKHETPKVKA